MVVVSEASETWFIRKPCAGQPRAGEAPESWAADLDSTGSLAQPIALLSAVPRHAWHADTPYTNANHNSHIDLIRMKDDMSFSGVPMTELGPAFQSPSEGQVEVFFAQRHVASVSPIPNPGCRRVCVFPGGMPFALETDLRASGTGPPP